MMAIIDRNRHFVSDCERSLTRLYREKDEIAKLIDLQGATKHLVFNRESNHRSILLWEKRHAEASRNFELGLDVWFFWICFYWVTFEDQGKRKNLWGVLA